MAEGLDLSIRVPHVHAGRKRGVAFRAAALAVRMAGGSDPIGREEEGTMSPEEKAVIDAAMKWAKGVHHWLLLCGRDNRASREALLPNHDRDLYDAVTRLRRASK